MCVPCSSRIASGASIRYIKYIHSISHIWYAETARETSLLGTSLILALPSILHQTSLGEVTAKVPLEEVLYFRSFDRLIYACHVGGELVMERRHGPLHALAEKLPAAFVWVHKSFLLRRSAIQAIERAPDRGYAIRLHGLSPRLPIARPRAKAVLAQLAAAHSGQQAP
ncbi:LytTR family DNA-binding domain-containing protein [Pseudomonas sp. Marseille-Q5115]|uniref:LytTR family DNA-binding domain-containing protein n=1 Tax=Pseudomonas sp. Marseille-Q5115 TaxID=2866593 RepID=UPI001CE4560B